MVSAGVITISCRVYLLVGRAKLGHAVQLFAAAVPSSSGPEQVVLYSVVTRVGTYRVHIPRDDDGNPRTLDAIWYVVYSVVGWLVRGRPGQGGATVSFDFNAD